MYNRKNKIFVIIATMCLTIYLVPSIIFAADTSESNDVIDWKNVRVKDGVFDYNNTEPNKLDWDFILKNEPTSEELHEKAISNSRNTATSTTKNTNTSSKSDNFDNILLFLVAVVICLCIFLLYDDIKYNKTKAKTSRKNVEETEHQQLGMTWFNFYTNILLIIQILSLGLQTISCLLQILSYGNEMSSTNTFLMILYNVAIAYYCYYHYLVYKRIKNKTENAVEGILIMLVISSLLIPLKITSTDIPYLLGFLIANFTYVLPNIIYFYKRKDIFKDLNTK